MSKNPSGGSPPPDAGDIVDCDVHVMSSAAVQRDIAERLDEPYRSLRNPDTGGAMSSYPNSGFAVTIPGEWELTSDQFDDRLDVRSALCDRFGVTHPIINMGPLGLDYIPSKERALKEMRATNDVLVDRFVSPGEDFYGAMSVVTGYPEEAAAEIDRIGSEDGVVGVYIPLPYVDPPLGDPQYESMFAAAERHGLAILTHGVGGRSIHYPNLAQSLSTFLESHTISHPTLQTINLVSMIYRGVPVKFPDLNVVCLEAGLGWAAYLIGRMDRDYRQRQFDAPLLDRKPSAYVRDQWYFGTQPLEEFDDPTHLEHFVDIIGEESIVFASDYPHFDFDDPTSVVSKYLNVDTEKRERILAGNAKNALGL